jgi:hypothetical protein
MCNELLLEPGERLQVREEEGSLGKARVVLDEAEPLLRLDTTEL